MNEICPDCGKRPSAGSRNCRRCHATYMREHRSRHADLSPDDRLRANCRSYANVYQRRGKLIPGPCVICQSTVGIEKHHEDYTKPLYVIWVCHEHHADMTNGRRRVPTLAERWAAAFQRMDARHQHEHPVAGADG